MLSDLPVAFNQNKLEPAQRLVAGLDFTGAKHKKGSGFCRCPFYFQSRPAA
jgi:hypothetical protein